MPIEYNVNNCEMVQLFSIQTNKTFWSESAPFLFDYNMLEERNKCAHLWNSLAYQISAYICSKNQLC